MIARNPDADSSLPFLLRLPLGPDGLVLKARETWPRTGKVYCHRADAWPDDVELVEEVEVRTCVRRGVAVDLVLARGREQRSQFVFTRLGNGREAIFWQTARTARTARPGVRVPVRRASDLTAGEWCIAIDTRERYPYRFANRQVTTERRALPAGDYGVLAGDEVVAVVERKSLTDLVHGLVDGSLQYRLADLATLPAAAVVVEERYSSLFKVERMAPGWAAELLGRHQARYPTVPIVFCETRPLAEQWTFRYLGARLALALDTPADPAAPRQWVERSYARRTEGDR
ncbi:MAG: ERCC4 domain-containing protein [Acidimicrobiales bacterium]